MKTEEGMNKRCACSYFPSLLVSPHNERSAIRPVFYSAQGQMTFFSLSFGHILQNRKAIRKVLLSCLRQGGRLAIEKRARNKGAVGYVVDRHERTAKNH